MKRISLVVLISLSGTGSALAKSPVCRSFGYYIKSCDLHQGFYPKNGSYLEGLGLETLHFVAAKGLLTAFPPAGGTVLKAVKPCGKAPLVPNATVTSCRAHGKAAATCTVHFPGTPKICLTKLGQTGNGDETLIAVPGYWDNTGVWIGDASTVTLACDVPEFGAPSGSVNSAVGTCVGGGYSLEPGPSRPAFLACVRAVRADYCGNGTPHTMPNTQIGIHDPRINKMTRDKCADGADPDGLDYEATWSPDGAICFFHDRWFGPGLSDDSCNAKIKAQPCQPNDSRGILSTRSSCNVCPSVLGAAPECPPDRDPVCATSASSGAH